MCIKSALFCIKLVNIVILMLWFTKRGIFCPTTELLVIIRCHKGAGTKMYKCLFARNTILCWIIKGHLLFNFFLYFYPCKIEETEKKIKSAIQKVLHCLPSNCSLGITDTDIFNVVAGSVFTYNTNWLIKS